MGQAPSGNTAFGSRSTIPLQSSMNLPSLPHAPVEGFPIPTWSFQESYETIVSSQVRYYADPYTAPAVAPYPSVTDRITGQSASGGAILHDGAYENDPGVTYCVTGQSASSGAVPHDDGYDIDRVASTPMPQDPIIFQHPPTAVSANGADNVQPSGSFTSQPAPGWRPGGIKWRNVQSWAECVALKTNETHGSTQRPSRHIDTTPTPGANTGVNTLPARVPSPDETTTATPRPLRVMNVTPGHTATPRPAANTQPVQEAQASTPTFDVDAMVTRAYDETAQAAQEIDNQTTTRLTELAVVVTERRLNTPPPHKERPDTPTTAMAVDHLLREDMRRGFYHLLKMAIQPRYVAEPAPALLPKGTEANLKLWGSKVEETAVAEVVAEVVADARGVHLWQPRAWGMRHIADIQRMEDIADIFAENFIKPYVPGFRG